MPASRVLDRNEFDFALEFCFARHGQSLFLSGRVERTGRWHDPCFLGRTELAVDEGFYERR